MDSSGCLARLVLLALAACTVGATVTGIKSGAAWAGWAEPSPGLAADTALAIFFGVPATLAAVIGAGLALSSAPFGPRPRVRQFWFGAHLAAVGGWVAAGAAWAGDARSGDVSAAYALSGLGGVSIVMSVASVVGTLMLTYGGWGLTEAGRDRFEEDVRKLERERHLARLKATPAYQTAQLLRQSEQLRAEVGQRHHNSLWDIPDDAVLPAGRRAEIAAARWMRQHGFPDANVTAIGPDDGVDVVSRDGFAQVKDTGQAIGIEIVQRHWAVATSKDRLPLVFSRSGFTAQAQRWATEHGMALLRIDEIDGVVALNAPARKIAESGSEVTG